MSRVRTFLAVDVAQPIRARLAALQDAFARAGVAARWAAAETFHVTLLFLGDTDDRDLARLCTAVASVCDQHGPFTLSVEGVGCFPTPERPRVLWAGIAEGADELKALNADLAASLMDLGLFSGDEHRYNPHLTLGRIKGGGSLTEALEAKAGWSGGACKVGEVRVMASDLRHGGPEYSVLSTARLG